VPAKDTFTMLENWPHQVTPADATGVSASIANADVALGRVNQGLAQIGFGSPAIGGRLPLNLTRQKPSKASSPPSGRRLGRSDHDLQSSSAYPAALRSLKLRCRCRSLLDFIPELDREPPGPPKLGSDWTGHSKPPPGHVNPGVADASGVASSDPCPRSAFQILQSVTTRNQQIATVPWLLPRHYAPSCRLEQASLAIGSRRTLPSSVRGPHADEKDTVFVNLMGPFVVHPGHSAARVRPSQASGFPLRAPVNARGPA